MPDYSKLLDAELTSLLKTGDQHAFTEIYKRYWHLLYLHAYKMLDDEEEAKDLVQNLFIALYTKAGQLEIKTNLKAYLYVSVRHKIINLIRQKKVNDDFIMMVAEAMDETDDHTTQQLDERELIKVIDEEIGRLPPRMKEVFEMSRKEFLSNKEIAARLGTSEETVKKQISKSIKVLKDRLSKHVGMALLLMEMLRHR